MRNLLITFFFFIFSAFQIPPEEIKIFLIGDSTMSDKPLSDNPERGWGQLFSAFFDQSVVVKNHAHNGRSTKSFIQEGRWEVVLQQLRAGDWVMIQFGHNDSKIADSTRYAAPQTTYRQNLIRFVAEARKKGARPILITPVVRRKFDANGQLEDTHGEYPAVVKEVAQQQKVPLIDLHQKSQELLTAQGSENSKQLFLWISPGMYTTLPEGKKDDTHFSPYGATQIAALVAREIQHLNIDLAKKLKKSNFPEKLAFELPQIAEPVFRRDTFDIGRFGAIGDGHTLNTQAFTKAIEACSKASGGVVMVPPGLWLTGPIELKSHINLHLRKGALLLFSSNFDDYPLVKTTYEGLNALRCQSPISGYGLENIAITGEGILDGAGDAWRPVKKSKLTSPQWETLVASGGVLNSEKKSWYPSSKSLKGATAKNPGVFVEGMPMSEYEAIKDFLRPNMLSLTNCKRILLEGVTFQNSPAWCLHPLLSEHVTLKNLTVRNPWYAQNGDGVDLESCQNARIDNCTFDVGDDGICIKSGRDEEGRKRGIPTENVIVQNCVVYHGHGGFVIGSEMSGSVRNLFVSNCNFLGTDVGLRFKTTRGRGGVVENIYVADINMTNIVGDAILFDMYYAGKYPVPVANEKGILPPPILKLVTETTPQFRGFYLRNIVCHGAERGIFIQGLPEMNVKDIHFENLTLQARQGFTCIQGENIHLKNTAFLTPDPTVIYIQNSKHITLDSIGYQPGADLLMKISGKQSKAIRLINTDVSKARKEASFSDQAAASALVKK